MKSLNEIVAELRMGDDGGKPAYRIGRADKVEVSMLSGTPMRSYVIECVTIKELADWIEAAVAREHKPGNSAAMREALEYVLQFDATDEAAEQDGLTYAERIAEYADHISECQKKARAALSAPARNCDKYDNFNDALRQFVKERPDTKKIDEQGRSVATAETYCVFANWLLTPAAERKGEGDGR